jgi:hypothetical protein
MRYGQHSWFITSTTFQLTSRKRMFQMPVWGFKNQDLWTFQQLVCLVAFSVPIVEPVSVTCILATFSRVALPFVSEVFSYINKEYLQVVRLHLPIHSPWQMLQLMSSVVENKIEIEKQGFWVMCFTCNCTQLGSSTDGTTTLRHTGHVTAHYMIYHLFELYFK